MTLYRIRWKLKSLNGTGVACENLFILLSAKLSVPAWTYFAYEKHKKSAGTDVDVKHKHVSFGNVRLVERNNVNSPTWTNQRKRTNRKKRSETNQPKQTSLNELNLTSEPKWTNPNHQSKWVIPIEETQVSEPLVEVSDWNLFQANPIYS